MTQPILAFALLRFLTFTTPVMRNVLPRLTLLTLMALFAFALPAQAQIVINEADADTPGSDVAEFVELFNTGNTAVALDPYVLVFFNGSNDQSYRAIDLDGLTIQPGGYMVVGNAGVPNVSAITFPGNGLQNGADGIGLYTGSEADFPNGTAPTQTNLVDALVYDTNDGDDAGLLAGLGQTMQFNEGANGDKNTHSNQRNPDGTGTFEAGPATPGTKNLAQSVSFSFDRATQTIDEDGNTNVTVTMTTSNGQVLEAAASADVALTSGDAADLTGFTSPQSISYNAGQASGATTQITLTANDDALIEGSEDLVFTLNNFTGASSGANGTFTLSITDNDGPQVAFQTAALTANEGDGTVGIVLTLTQAPAANFSVDVALATGDAADLGNYTTQTVTFTPAGGLTQTVTVTITDDADLEGEEPFGFVLQNVQGNGSITPPSTLKFTLTDNEQPANLVINELDSDQPGAEDMEFVELYNNDNAQVVLDPYVLVFFNGSNDQSYAAFDLDGQTIAANGFFVLGDPNVPNANIAQNISLQNGADAVALYVGSAADFPNGTEATSDKLVAALGYGTSDATDFDLLRKLNDGTQFNESEYGNSDGHSLQRFPDGTGTPQPNFPTPGAANQRFVQIPRVALSDGSGSVDEGGSVSLELIVTTANSVATEAESKVDLVLTIGDPEDFSGLTGRVKTLTIPAGTANGGRIAFTIDTVDDTANEGDETVRFQLTGNTNSEITGQASYELSIVDDDQPGFAFQTATLAVNEGAGTAQVAVALSTASDTELTVDVVLTNGDATDIGGYTTQTLTFPAGSADPQTITLNIVDDDEAEGGETITFELQNQSASAKLNTPSTLALSIQDNDVVAGLVINEVDADTEGTDVMEFLELYNGTDAEIALDDYVLVFYNGNGDASYRAIDLDGFTVASKGYFLIGNADVPGISIEIPSNGIQNGADGVALYIGEAANFPDGTPVTGAGVIDALVYGTNDSDDAELLAAFGQTTQYDEGANGNKNFESVQRAPDGGSFVTALATPGGPADVSTQVVSVDPTSATVAEDAGMVTFEVRISAVPDADVTVDVALTNGDAADVSGFATQTLTFAAGNGSAQVVTVTVTDDAEDEGNETLTFTLQNVTGTATIGAGAFNLTITDNDGQTNTGSTLAEIRALDDGTEVEFEAVVTRAKGDFLRVQDETGGITLRQTSGDVFDGVAAGTIKPGDRVRVKGTLSEFRALKQINSGDLAEFEVLSSGDVPAPAMITLSDLQTNGERYESVLVKVMGLEIPGAAGMFEAATTYELAGDSGITLRTPNEDDSDIDGEPIPAGAFDFMGVVGQFSSSEPNVGYQLLPVNAGDIMPAGMGTTLADVRAMDDGAEVEFEAVVTRAKGDFLRVQDATGGITIRQTSGDVFDGVAAGTIKPGDRVRVKGTLSEFRALKQINGGDLAEFEVLSSGDVPAPAMITLADLETNGERYESVLVTIQGLGTPAEGMFEAATTYELLGTTAVTLRTPNEDDSDIDGLPIPPRAFTFTGVIGQFSSTEPNGGYQLLPINAGDIMPAGEEGQLGDIRTQPDGTRVEFEAIVTRAKGAFLRVQDPSGAITIRQTSGDVFDGVAAGTINPGDRVRVAGTLSTFRELRQINGGDLESFEIIEQGTMPPPPMDVTLAELAANGEQFESELVRVMDLMIPAESGVNGMRATFEAATTYEVSDPTLSTGTISLRVPNADDTDIDGEPIPTEPFTFIGVIGQFNSDGEDAGYQLQPIQADDIRVQGSGNNTAPAAAELITPPEGAALEVSGNSDDALEVSWQTATDPDGDNVSYQWQVSAQQDFSAVLTSISAGDATSIQVPIADIDALLVQAGLEIGDTATLYHRVVTSDGSLRTEGPARTVVVTRAGANVVEAESIAAARALDDGTLVRFSGIVTRAKGAFLRVQDETGGLSIRQPDGDVFDRLAAGQISPGDRVTVTGTLSEFRELKQINQSDLVSFDVTGSGDLPDPIEITLAELAANGERYESVLVAVPGVEIVGATGTFEARTTYNLRDDTLPDGTVSFRTPNADDTDIDGEAIPNGKFTYLGVIGQFNSDGEDAGYQLLPVEAGDILPFRVANEDEAEVPTNLVLHGNFPNPFNPSTRIAFDMPEASQLTLRLFDVTGREVRVIEQSVSQGRDQSVLVEMGTLPSGVYLYRIEAQGQTQTWNASGRMMLLK
ncbi:MAG: hypothetical protein RhofKO_06060 [Rhodothermales bacterium]